MISTTSSTSTCEKPEVLTDPLRTVLLVPTDAPPSPAPPSTATLTVKRERAARAAAVVRAARPSGPRASPSPVEGRCGGSVLVVRLVLRVLLLVAAVGGDRARRRVVVPPGGGVGRGRARAGR